MHRAPTPFGRATHINNFLRRVTVSSRLSSRCKNFSAAFLKHDMRVEIFFDVQTLCVCKAGVRWGLS